MARFYSTPKRYRLKRTQETSGIRAIERKRERFLNCQTFQCNLKDTLTPAIFASWDFNCCSENSGLIIVRIKNKIRDKMFQPSSFIFGSFVKWHFTIQAAFLFLNARLSLKRVLQDIFLLHGLGVTSRGLSMPFELQKSNRLSRGSRCPLKGLKSTDLTDYNQIFTGSETFFISLQ